jgi:protein SCO1/2
MLGGMLRILVVGLLVLVVALMLIGRQSRTLPQPVTATLLPESRALPVTAFVDKNGNSFSTGDLAGQYTLLFFGFTNCPDICPLTLQVLALAKAEIAARQPAAVPRVAFVSVDPYRDSPATVRRYVDNFDADFIGLTASDSTLAPLLQALGVTVHKNEVEGERYNVVHNGTIYVLDADAQWFALFSGSDHDAETVATDYLRLRRLRAANAASAGLSIE